MQNRLLKLAEPELNLYRDKAIDISHITCRENDAESDKQDATEKISGVEKKCFSCDREVPPFSPQKCPE